MAAVDDPKVSQPSVKNEDPKEKGFLNRPRNGGKSFWDWLDLFAKLAIPLVVVLATIGFGLWQVHLADLQHQYDQNLAQQQHDADQKRAQDQQQAAILQTYIDNIQDLLLNHNLLKSKPTDDVAILARARTLTALQGLDSHRKGVLLKFLYEARLIGFIDPYSGKKSGPILNLFLADLTRADLTAPFLSSAAPSAADLVGVNLSFAYMSFANLVGANLNEANLNRATLSSANLREAHLSRADLGGTNFSGANLRFADLSGSTLSSARLSGADLTGADLGGTDIIQEQIDEVASCKYTLLPQGLICHHQ